MNNLPITEEQLFLIDKELTASTKTGYSFRQVEVKRKINLLPTVREIKQFLKNEIHAEAKNLDDFGSQIGLGMLNADNTLKDQLLEIAMAIAKHNPEINIGNVLDEPSVLNYQVEPGLSDEASLEREHQYFNQMSILLNTIRGKLKGDEGPIPKQFLEIARLWLPPEKMNEYVTHGLTDPMEHLARMGRPLIPKFYQNQYLVFLKSTLETYISKPDDEVEPFHAEPLPGAWTKIQGNLSDEQIWAFFSFLWQETCAEKDNKTFMRVDDVKELLRYGLAYPSVPDRKFILNTSPKRKLGIMYNAMFYLYEQHHHTYKRDKMAFAEFLSHHFENFGDTDIHSIYGRIRSARVNSQNFEFGLNSKIGK